MRIRPGSIVPYDNAPQALKDPKADRYALVISLGDIENGRVDRLASFVDTATSTVPTALTIVGKCMLTVDGYNNDPRDLTQIPEVRAYFQQVPTEAPLLPFLLEPVREELMLYAALAGNGRRQIDESYHPDDPLLAKSHGTTFSDKSTLGTAGLAYASALSAWLDTHCLAEQTSHPLYKAHERSMECFRSVLEGSGPMIRPV